MEPPSLRELELETLLRERDSQVAELTDEVNQLRKYLTTQPGPSRSDPFSLPPVLLALLQPHIKSQPSATGQSATSSTMTAALMQRARVLQEENDELYGLLRLSETGQLKEEVRSLKKVITRLDRALKDSHGVVSSLSEELDKSYTSFLSHQQQKSIEVDRRETPDSPLPQRVSGHSLRAESPSVSNNGDIKPLPTGPRAHKKPRLSEPCTSPARSTTNLPLSTSNSTPLGALSRRSRRDRSPYASDNRRSPVKEPRRDGDEDVKKGRDLSNDGSWERDKELRDGQQKRERSRAHDHRDRERDTIRPRDKEKEKDRERERERDRARRNGRGSGAGGGSRKGGRGNTNQDDRTLRQRMGL